jgi:O-antigen/teichoic acid export membrane protein
MSSAALNPKRRDLRAMLSHFAKNAPFAIAASSLQGAVNYIIVVYLAYNAGMHATGAYRTLFSCYSLLGLAAMYETNKVFIRSIVAGDHEATTALFANRLLFSLGAFLVVVAMWAAGALLGWDGMSGWVVAVAAISAIIYPLDSYLSLMQARGRFNLLFFSELLKYGLALAAFLVALRSGWSVEQAMMAQLIMMALCHVAYFSLVTRTFVDFDLVRRRFRQMIGSEPARQARLYSFANLVPSSLEHIDKLLVGWVLGLEFLGVYTLAYSTGRFLYNTLKPALYIYYRRFVDKMPGWRLLRLVGLAFTLFGISNAVIFLLSLAYIPAMHRFQSGAVATVILFLAYGVGIVRAVYGQAFSLHKDSDARHALWASVQATLLSLACLTAALLSPQPIALVLLALQYPIRDGLTVLLMHYYRTRDAVPALAPGG